MAEATRPRGAGDTTAVPVARLPRFERGFVRALAVALLLHLPFVPLRFFDWVRWAFPKGLGDYDDAPAVIPIDLDLLAREPVAEPPPAPAPLSPPPAPTAPPPTPGQTHPPAAPHPPAPADARSAALVDPVRAAGGAGKFAAADANVQILLSGSALRKHAIGPWAARLLVMIPEWRPFFEGGPVDPIRDFDHLLLTAPRLAVDNSKLVAILDYNVSTDLAREAVDRVLHRTGGVWVEDVPVPTARARVAGAPRYIALVPGRHLLAVMPGDRKDMLGQLQHIRSGFKSSAEGAVVSMLTPARPFAPFFPLPATLKWLRLALIPTADGGADLALDAGDGDHDQATAHAEFLTREIEARRKVDLGVTTIELFAPVTFAAEGDTIRARTHVPAQKLAAIMAYVEQKAKERFGGR